MSEMLPVRKAAALWNLSERQVSKLCKEGRVPGATKEGKSWIIPIDAQRPIDKRIKSGAYKKAVPAVKLPQPIGISDYRTASTEYYYIDKTLLIKDFIDKRPLVTLFTRPKGFGKSLNMDMLRTFFEKSEEDTSIYFHNKKIWECGEKYQSYQGKFPVIFITFKDAKKDTWEETYECIVQLITMEFKRHSELADSSKVQDGDFYQKMITGHVGEALMDSSLFMLSKMLHEHYRVAPIIIIDDYDIPIQQGYMQGYYDKVALFMRNLFCGGLKDNKHLSYGFLTGVLQVAKGSVLGNLNNLVICSVLDDRYSDYFGFTQDEVKKMTQYYGVPKKFNEIRRWYGGYHFGKSEIYNPWSVINYFGNECQPQTFWQTTEKNIIGEIIETVETDTYEKLISLVTEKPIFTYVDTGVIYPQVEREPSAVFSFLLVTGYLTATSSSALHNEDFIYEVVLPNQEIRLINNKAILQQLSRVIPQSIGISIQDAIHSSNSEKLKNLVQALLIQSASFCDTGNENSFILGLCTLLSGSYQIIIEKSPYARYGIELMPRNLKLPGILINLKVERNSQKEELKKQARVSLNQIHNNGEMTSRGVLIIYKYGVAINGKQVEVAMG